MTSDQLIVRVAADLVTEVRKLCPSYAGDASPMHEGQVLDILRQRGCLVNFFAFHGTRAAFADGFLGRTVVAINTEASRPRRELGIRHELSHDLAEDVAAEPVFMNEEQHYMSWAERVADLFAVADLVPRWALDRCETAQDLLDEAFGSLAAFAKGSSLRVLMPYVREIVSNCSNRGMFGPFWMDPISIQVTESSGKKG